MKFNPPKVEGWVDEGVCVCVGGGGGGLSVLSLGFTTERQGGT